MGLTRRTLCGLLLATVACTMPLTPYGLGVLSIGFLIGVLMSLRVTSL